ncbi:MAG: F0F1 ATP synthase subunit B [Gammaproteobacteria bacterium]|nr:F0F1 ATP synthase subunit B [Gammaproteobacteria bacterium]
MNVTATLIGQIGTFLVLVWFVMRFLWEPITKMMEERTKRIADGLAAAERGRHERELAEKEAKKRLKTARKEAGQIIDHANKRGDEIIEEAKETAHLEGQRQLEAAKAEIDKETNRAKELLREQLADLVIAGTRKILEREVNVEAHGELIANLAKKL